VTLADDGDEVPAALDFAALFAANTHEIKNQLFLLLNAVEQASREPWASEFPSARIALEELKRGGDQISQRLTRLLSLYRIAQGHYQLDIAYHGAAALLEEVLLEIQPFLGGHAVEMVVESTDGVYGFFDRELVRGVLLNAVHNALHVAVRKVSLSAAMEDGYLCIRVADDGPGFPPHVLETGMAQAKWNLGGGSTGLGLHFSATAAALHRNRGKSGFIRLSNEGALKGAVFTLCLP
jgi:signal transduction histidine kinase